MFTCNKFYGFFCLVLFCFALLLSESKCSSFMGIIGCDFRKSRCECDFGMRSGDRRLLKALRNQKQIDAKKVKIYLNKTFWNKYISFLLNQMIKSVHNNHTSDLHHSFKFKIKFSKVWGTRLRQWTDNASSRGGSRRSPYSIFANVSLWGHIRHLSNLLDGLSFIYISELCWKIITIYRTDGHLASCLSKKTSHAIRNLTFSSVYRWSTICISRYKT